MQANAETAERLLPNKAKKKELNKSKDPRVVVARENVQKAFNKFQNNTNNRNEESLRKAKKELDKVYTTVMEENLSKLLEDVETTDNRFAHTRSTKRK